MRFRSALALVVLGTGFLGAAPTDPVPFSPFPVPPPAPPLPAPAPAPAGTVLNLTSDVLYIVNSKTDAVLRAHPAGLVKVTKEAGPLRIRGKFVDGTGGVETRTYAGPCVFTVEALPNQTGRVELDLIPVGFKDEKEILTAPVDVNSGQAPQPPPIDPNPPIVPIDPFFPALQAAYNAEPVSVAVSGTTYTKASDKTRLAAALRSLATAVNDPVVKNGDDNFTLLTNTTQTMIGMRLKAQLRPVIGTELNKIIPSGSGKGAVALTDQNRKDAAAFYLRVADLLDKNVK